MKNIGYAIFFGGGGGRGWGQTTFIVGYVQQAARKVAYFSVHKTLYVCNSKFTFSSSPLKKGFGFGAGGSKIKYHGLNACKNIDKLSCNVSFYDCCMGEVKIQIIA